MVGVNPDPQRVQPAVPLDYAQDGRGGTFADWARGFRAEINERIDGLFRFLGMLIGLIGGVRQLIWTLGFSFAGAGLGCSLQHYPSGGPGMLKMSLLVKC